MQARFVGLPWFYADDYEAFKSVLPDRRWHATFNHWLRAAEQTEQNIKDGGLVPVKAYARSGDFVAWCKASGLDINTDALIAFANQTAIRATRDIKEH